MNSLRIALLIVGVLIVAGIYFWSVIRRRRKSSYTYQPHFTNTDYFEDGADPLGYLADGEDSQHPVSAIEQVRMVSDDEDLPNPVATIEQVRVVSEHDFDDDMPSLSREETERYQEPVTEPEPEQEQELAVGDNQFEMPFDGANAKPAETNEPEANEPEANEPEANEPEAKKTTSDETLRQEAAPGNLLILYVGAPNGGVFRGSDLVKALNAVGMRYGDMEIFHHFGAGELVTERPIFSAANMLEPGVFDLQRMEYFETSGLAMFVQLPTPLDGPVAFELFLNTAQRLAERLRGDLLGDNRAPLDSAMIDHMRRQASQYGDGAL